MTRKLSLVATTTMMIATIVITGCSKKAEEAKPVEKAEATKPAAQTLTLKDYGPTEIKAGKDFNLQKGGYNAIWVHGENITPNTIIVINGVKLKGNKHANDPTLLSSEVPKDLYKAPGEAPIYLLDTQTNAKSNELKFVVK